MCMLLNVVNKHYNYYNITTCLRRLHTMYPDPSAVPPLDQPEEHSEDDDEVEDDPLVTVTTHDNNIQNFLMMLQMVIAFKLFVPVSNINFAGDYILCRLSTILAKFLYMVSE